MPKQQQQMPTTPAEFEGWWVEFGPKDKRKAGTVIASRPDGTAPWAFINPGVEKNWRAAPASRARQPTEAARVIVLVQQRQEDRDGRLVWAAVGDGDPPRPVFASPKLGALLFVKAPNGPKPQKVSRARTSKAGGSKGPTTHLVPGEEAVDLSGPSPNRWR